MKKAVVLLPTFNEKDNLGDFVASVFDQEKATKDWQFEVLIVDSHSSDGTLELAKKIAEEERRVYVLTVGMGLGVALVEGHQYAISHLQPDALAQLDADGQVSVEVLPKLLKVLDEGYDLAIGSRFVQGGLNKLSLTRRIFSWGSCTFCRVVMGPFNIHEFTNSARAFTPELFNKINLKRLPWREKTFIIQPAFLNEAILAGAKYKEVPLVFKNRAEGYSKNKVVNYTYDVMTYCIDARLHKWGVKFPFFRASRRVKTIIKFSVVGLSGTIIDFAFYNLFIAFLHLAPASARLISIPIAILNNFLLNNYWTFRNRKNETKIWLKLIYFYMISLGGVAIAVLITKYLHLVYGDGIFNLLGLKIAYYNLFFFATVPPVMIWNFTVNHFITWRHKGG